LTTFDYIVSLKTSARWKARAMVDDFGGFVSHFDYP